MLNHLTDRYTFTAPIGQESIQSTPIPRNDKQIERLDDPRMVQAIIKEELDQNNVRIEEAWEEENDKTQEPKYEDTIGLAKFELKFMSFRLVYLERDHIKINMFVVFKDMRVNIPHLNLIKQTPPVYEFSNDICALIRKINLHLVENNFVSGSRLMLNVLI